MDILELPFKVIKAPHLKLKTPSVPNVGPMVVFALVFASYFLVLSGLIYDVIVEPPSIGSVQDEVTGAVKPQVFLQYRVNGQYIIEGLSAGMLFCVGGLGFIILDFANNKNVSQNNRYILIVAGLLCVVITYNLSIVFLKMKVPGYLRA